MHKTECRQVVVVKCIGTCPDNFRFHFVLFFFGSLELNDAEDFITVSTSRYSYIIAKHAKFFDSVCVLQDYFISYEVLDKLISYEVWHISHSLHSQT
ncbi:unnamed protein product [Trifolium pratense]|uniref:Uncharacterized protein n=1 Tax=Trifolium pratense TaxID=57577 RepID=A0ACB0LVM4_TRIPR|nr:unnamed protein product [Trifolium pratense]